MNVGTDVRVGGDEGSIVGVAVGKHASGNNKQSVGEGIGDPEDPVGVGSTGPAGEGVCAGVEGSLGLVGVAGLGVGPGGFVGPVGSEGPDGSVALGRSVGLSFVLGF